MFFTPMPPPLPDSLAACRWFFAYARHISLTPIGRVSYFRHCSLFSAIFLFISASPIRFRCHYCLYFRHAAIIAAAIIAIS
jgi:hypothetical protein